MAPTRKSKTSTLTSMFTANKLPHNISECHLPEKLSSSPVVSYAHIVAIRTASSLVFRPLLHLKFSPTVLAVLSVPRGFHD